MPSSALTSALSEQFVYGAPTIIQGPIRVWVQDDRQGSRTRGKVWAHGQDACVPHRWVSHYRQLITLIRNKLDTHWIAPLDRRLISSSKKGTKRGAQAGVAGMGFLSTEKISYTPLRW